MQIMIRKATPDDAASLLSIYEYYVLNTAITFEYEVPSLEEFRDRISHTLEKFPYLVAEDQGRILGYAYAGPFHPRAAYAWDCEMSIYLMKDARRLGLGRMLYEALEKELISLGYLNLYACIAYPDPEDEHLNMDSVRFHEHSGYHEVGRFRKCGYKFGRWYDMIWMEKIVGEHLTDQPAVRSFNIRS